MIRSLLLVAALAVPLPAARALPQLGFGGPGGDRASTEMFVRRQGDELRVALRVEIDPGWHLYHTELGPPDAVGKPTTVTLSGEGVAWSSVVFPEPHRLEQPGLGDDGADTWIWGHEGTIVLFALGRLEPGADPGTVEAEMDGLTCQDDGSCVPYGETVEPAGAGDDALFAAFPAGLAIDASGGSSGAQGARSPPGHEPVDDPSIDYEAVDFSEFAARSEGGEHGLFTWLLLAFVAGVLLNVMPCVLPVISIKVLSFVQQAGEDRHRVVQLGLAFAAGILIVFEALALLAILLGQSWGEQFQSQAFLVVMIGIVFALSLSLFGLFELGVPSGVGGLASLSREGLGDAFFKGMLATLLATPCSGPFLGSTLAWTLQQTPVTILLVFTVLGLGMALPYVVLTANPRLLKHLPRPGPWMETFKQSMGFVLLLTVVYLMISLKQDLLLFTVAFLVAVGIGCWWYGRFATFDKSSGRRFAHLAVALAIVAGGARLAFVEFRGLFAGAQNERVAWVDFEPEAFRRHLDQGRSVFVDWTATWCPNCKYNERFVFESEEVRRLLERKGVVAMTADITHDTPRTRMLERFLNQLGARSIPFMAVFPGDDPQRPHVRPDVVTVGDVVGILETLPDPPGAATVSAAIAPVGAPGEAGPR